MIAPVFFALTGQHLEGTAKKIHQRQVELMMVRRMVDDQVLLDKARSSKNSDKFNVLWDGSNEEYPSISEADLAFCMQLVFWSDRDKQQVDRLFRQSKRMRPKWDEVHSSDGRTYGQMTIDKALELQTDTYTGKVQHSSKEAPATRVIPDEYGQLIQINTGSANSPKWTNYKRKVSGHEFLLLNPKTDDFLEAIQATGNQVCLNSMNDKILVGNEVLSDVTEALILNRLQDFGLKGVDRIRRALLEAADRNSFHPILNYLDNLPEWNGKVNYLSWLNSSLIYTDETAALGPILLKRWLVGSVARVYKQAQNFMLVIDGPQGVGKSYLARWLCPLTDYFTEGPIHPETKDCLLAAISNWLWEVGELQATTRRAHRESLKHFISQKYVEVRPPYGRHAIKKPVVASYIGTINGEAGFLDDDTGNRRFGIIGLQKIRWDYTEIPLDKLWSQIVTMYRNGEPWALQPDEILLQEEVNLAYESPSFVESILHKHYEWEPEQTTDANFIATAEIAQRIREEGSKDNDTALMMKISTYLSRQKVTKGRQDAIRGWFGIQEKQATKTQDEPIL